MMLDILAKEHVEQVSPEGEPFDPAYHEAMSVVENPDMEPNSVVQVISKGLYAEWQVDSTSHGYCFEDQ